MTDIKYSLYRDIFALQGIRNPAVDYNGLEKARGYIEAVLSELNIAYTSEPFYLDGFEQPFYNIDADFGDSSRPVLYIGSHYDTADLSPGANDNASGTAVMLMLARLLQSLEHSVHVRLLFFTLEENNPVYELYKRETERNLNITNSQGFFTELRYNEDQQAFKRAMTAAAGNSTSYAQQFELAYKGIYKNLSPQMRDYYGSLAQFNRGFSDRMGFGQRALIGSSRWAESCKPENSDTLGMIDLDCVGYSVTTPYSQIIPGNVEINESNSYLVDPKRQCGNFIAAIANKGATRLAQTFLKGARDNGLPYYHYDCPHSYETVAGLAPELLLADHAPFWKRELPCLFVTDTGGVGRYWFEHTAADTIDKLNFDFMAQVVLSLYSGIRQLYM